MAKRPISPPPDLSVPAGETDPGRAGGDLASHPAETARYIGAMTAELSTLARAANLDLLAYFLDMARMEATGIVHDDKRRG